MSLRRLLPTNRKAEVDRRNSLALENDRRTTYTSNTIITAVTAPRNTYGADSSNDRMRPRNLNVPLLSGRDSVTLPVLDELETESSLTDTLGDAETSEVAYPSPRYSKRPSGKFKFSLTSHLYEFC